MLKDHTDVLIVGAGPTGMALSIALHQAGVDHLIIDRLEQGQNTSRAGVIHAHTLEALTPLGVVDQMLELGLKLHHFTVRDRDRALLKLGFGKLPSAHRYLLMLPQNVTERILENRIAALGGTVHRGVTATAIRQDSDGAYATVVKDGREHAISARYIVGGDGMHSVVRGATGIDFEGGTYEESFVLADVRMDWPFVRDEVSLFFSPEGLVVVAPLPGGTYRVVATLQNAPEHPSIEDIQRIVDTRGPTTKAAKVNDVEWSSRFRLHHRLATSYRKDRLLLMGDAAHVHSPAGGQGMNTGLVDAVVLGDLVSGVVTGKRAEAELDLYEQLRRPAAEKVLGLAGTMTKMATTRGRTKRFVRNLILWAVDLNPIAKRRIQLNLSGLSRADLARVPPPSLARYPRPVEVAQRRWKTAA